MFMLTARHDVRARWASKLSYFTLKLNASARIVRARDALRGERRVREGSMQFVLVIYVTWFVAVNHRGGVEFGSVFACKGWASARGMNVMTFGDLRLSVYKVLVG